MKQIEIEARALVLKFMMPVDELHKYPMCIDTAKQCALILIAEMLRELTEVISLSVSGFRYQYWKDLKGEIEKI